MKKTLSLLITILVISFSTVGLCGNIVYPWRATTAIVKAGENFEVWFNSDNGQAVNSVTLQGPYNTVTTTKTILTGRWVYDKTSLNTYNTKITVTVPTSAPADRYDITLNTSTGQVTSLAGVKVIKEYKTSYYILHFSDVHAFQSGYNTTFERLSTIIDIANIIDPEIVFNTGDNLYRPTGDRMNQYFIGDSILGTKGLNKLNAATFTTVGNHDFDFDNVAASGFYAEKSAWWNTWWGLQSYNFKYGNGRFMAINDAWAGFNTALQITDAVSWLNSVGPGNLRLGAAHIKDQRLVPLDNRTNLGLVLIGHNHFLASENPAILNNKPIQYVVNSVRDNVEFNLFKVDGTTGNYVPVSGPTAQVQYLQNPINKETPSAYVTNLTLNYSNVNDGLFPTNTATIINKFNFPISDAKVRFIMPLGSLYDISKGKIEQSFKGTSFYIVDVRIDLNANSTTVIDITKIDGGDYRTK